jgi:hypothetical protein
MSPLVFICYRRGDTAPYAGRLYSDLRRRFADHEVFMDVAIRPGASFVHEIERAISSSEVLLVLIGPDWLQASDRDGARRLDDPEDLVRLEIEMALARDAVVIPLLVHGARMPSAEELPAPLAPLVRRNRLALRDDQWEDDVGQVVNALSERGAVMPNMPSRSPAAARTMDDHRSTTLHPSIDAAVYTALICVALVAIAAAAPRTWLLFAAVPVVIAVTWSMFTGRGHRVGRELRATPSLSRLLSSGGFVLLREPPTAADTKARSPADDPDTPDAASWAAVLRSGGVSLLRRSRRM